LVNGGVVRIYKNLKTGDAFVIWTGDNFGEVHGICPEAVHTRVGKACTIPGRIGEIYAPAAIHVKAGKVHITSLLPEGYVET
jgi:hypothetical protein